MATAWNDEAFQTDVLTFCKRQGWSRHKLAREAGLAHTQVYSWLSGVRGLSLHSTCALAVACDLSLDDYVG